MIPDLSNEGATVLTTFGDAYEPYLEGRLRDRGLAPPSGWQGAVGKGRAWLVAELEGLLARDFDVQRRSPLEVFQDAMRFPTAALRAAGVPPVPRDDAEARVLPGDLYGLAPASSRDLGENAWRAHLAWGVAKAKAVGGAVPASAGGSPSMRRSSVAFVGTDLMDRTRIEAAVTGSGFTFEVWRNPAAVGAGLEAGPPVLALVDLSHSSADDAIRAIVGAGVRCIAFGPHVDDIALVRAQSLGATDVFPRSRFFKRLPDLLPKQA
jgi:hypothetical protein